jgi:hypothetical protein
VHAKEQVANDVTIYNKGQALDKKTKVSISSERTSAGSSGRGFQASNVVSSDLVLTNIVQIAW